MSDDATLGELIGSDHEEELDNVNDIENNVMAEGVSVNPRIVNSGYNSDDSVPDPTYVPEDEVNVEIEDEPYSSEDGEEHEDDNGNKVGEAKVGLFVSSILILLL